MNQGTPAVATLHNITINNILNLHYLQVILIHGECRVIER